MRLAVTIVNDYVLTRYSSVSICKSSFSSVTTNTIPSDLCGIHVLVATRTRLKAGSSFITFISRAFLSFSFGSSG